MSELDAAQAALAGEHACVYGYGVVGAAVAAELEPAARDAFDTHRRRRDELAAVVRAGGAEPVAALPGYALPLEVVTSDDAVTLAALLEQRQAGPLADLVAAARGVAVRERAAGWLVDAAVRGASWSGTVTALPGIDPPPWPGRAISNGSHPAPPGEPVRTLVERTPRPLAFTHRPHLVTISQRLARPGRSTTPEAR